MLLVGILTPRILSAEREFDRGSEMAATKAWTFGLSRVEYRASTLPEGTYSRP
jgi:hypothetical protein